eukprot:TRINITY_DN7056_c0_g1_i7.p1 TRINITY_DN7056_c0_g1~~TRINITY_DN7056_c0_g1_i7.p1  ORF type:complete len:147 (-),score=35.71 TRINITY_DN7056_c0_g1_i7:187-627(-)
MRTSEYGSPFLNTNGGRRISDWENKRRLRTYINNLINQERENGSLGLDFSMLKNKYSPYIFAGVGLVAASFWAAAYCSPKSRYMPNVLRFLCILEGWKIGTDYYQRSAYKFVTINFGRFPADVQRALENEDARYLYAIQDSVAKTD